MKAKMLCMPILLVSIAAAILLNSCDDEEGNCAYVQSTATANCGSGYYPVSSSGCCPASSPFYCSETNTCYAFCSTAESNCGYTQVIRANTGGGGGGCQLSGTWVRQSSANGCQGLKVNMSGSSGTVSSAPSSCCYSSGFPIWRNFNASNCTIEISILNSIDCSFIRYEEHNVNFNNANSVTIGSGTYLRQ
jgi:hypothetical protein